MLPDGEHFFCYVSTVHLSNRTTLDGVGHWNNYVHVLHSHMRLYISTLKFSATILWFLWDYINTNTIAKLQQTRLPHGIYTLVHVYLFPHMHTNM